MHPSPPARRSKRTAVRIFVLLFVALMGGFYVSGGPDGLGLGSVWAILVILAVLGAPRRAALRDITQTSVMRDRFHANTLPTFSGSGQRCES